MLIFNEAGLPPSSLFADDYCPGGHCCSNKCQKNPCNDHGCGNGNCNCPVQTSCENQEGCCWDKMVRRGDACTVPLHLEWEMLGQQLQPNLGNVLVLEGCFQAHSPSVFPAPLQKGECKIGNDCNDRCTKGEVMPTC